MDNREHYLKAFLIAGLVMGGLSGIPGLNLGNCCCLWQILGGAMAGWILCRSAGNPVRAGEGALVGLFSGLIGAMIFSVMTALSYLWNPDDLNFSMEQVLQGQDLQIPPEAQAVLDQAMSIITHPALALGVLLFFSLIIFAILAMIGALVSVGIFEPRFALTRLKRVREVSYKPMENVKMPEIKPGSTDLYFPRKEKEGE